MAITAEQAKRKLHQQGLTQKEWAKARGYTPEYVTRVLNGTCKARRGKGHEIAVALGIKDPVAA